jgi:hypothetical protein
VDPQRGRSAEDQDGRWYSGEHGYQQPDWDRGNDPRHQQAPPEPQYGDPAGYHSDRYGDPEPYRVPDQRGGYAPDGYAALPDPVSGPIPVPGSVSAPPPVSGLPPTHGQTETLPHLGNDGVLPPLPGSDPGDNGGVRRQTESIDRSSLRRPNGGPGPLGDGVYRSRRPGTAAGLIAVTVLMELVALRVLYDAVFTHLSAGGALGAAFAALGLPMFGFGVYGLLGGVAAAPGTGPRVWLRPPLVYLPLALILFLAAGLAAA